MDLIPREVLCSSFALESPGFLYLLQLPKEHNNFPLLWGGFNLVSNLNLKREFKELRSLNVLEARWILGCEVQFPATS